MKNILKEKFMPASLSHFLLCLMIGLGVAASVAFVGLHRAGLEADNRATLLALEWTQLKNIAAKNGYTADEALAYMLAEDEDLFSGIVYKEPTLYDWQTSGYLQISTGAQLLNDIRSGGWQTAGDFELDKNHNYVLLYDEEMQDRVFEHLAHKTSAQNFLHTFKAGSTTLYAVETSYPYTDLIAFGIGFGEEDLELLAKYDLDVVVQIRNFPKLDEESLDFAYGNLGELNILAAGFNDLELPGVSQSDWENVSKYLAELLKEQNLPTISIEFYSQKGLQSFAEDMDYNLVRLHPISEAELTKLSDIRVQERFALAASERSMGVLMLRLRPAHSLDEAISYVGAVKAAVEAKGVATDRMTAVPNMEANLPVLVCALLAVWAGGVLLLQSFDLKKTAWILATLGLLAGMGLLAIGKIFWLQKLLGLAAVIVFPFLGVAYIVREHGRSLPSAVLNLCAMTVMSLCGAALVVGTMSDKAFMSGMNTFSGVKVGQLMPLLLLMVYLLYRLANDHGGVKYLLVGFWRLMNKKVTIGLVLLGCVAAGLLLIYMLRSGNTSVGVSDLERTFRAFLDRVLVVRPRTKEFMFAHPIMLAMLYFGYRRQLWPMVLLGAIGQVSLVNTFEHLHTPVLVSLLRTANGLALGLLLGVGLVLFVKYAGGWVYRRVQEIAKLAEEDDYGA